MNASLQFSEWNYFKATEIDDFHNDSGCQLHKVRTYDAISESVTPDGSKERLEYIDNYHFEEWDLENENGNRRFTFLFDEESILLYPILMVGKDTNEDETTVERCYFFEIDFKICRLINMMRYQQKSHRNFNESKMSTFTMDNIMSKRIKLGSELDMYGEAQYSFTHMIVNGTDNYKMTWLQYN